MPETAESQESGSVNHDSSPHPASELCDRCSRNGLVHVSTSIEIGTEYPEEYGCIQVSYNDSGAAQQSRPEGRRTDHLPSARLCKLNAPEAMQ
jgi:hypothetical protein